MPKQDRKYKRDKGSKIESIISAMDELITEQGYDGFSINAVPTKAGLSIGTIYRYFPCGKIDILQEMMKRNTTTLRSLVDFDSLNETTFYLFWNDIIVAYIDTGENNSFYYSAIRSTCMTSLDSDKDIRQIITNFYGPIADQMKNLRPFKTWSKKELLVKVQLVFTILSQTREIHQKHPLFKSEEQFVKYLHNMVLGTFGMKM